MESRPTVAVVICAFTLDRWHLLTRAVASVGAQDIPSDLILVIDHNDELLERSRQHWPDVMVIANNNEQGLSGARNTGVAATVCELIAFLDDDAAASPEWLAHLTAPFADPTVGLTAGRVHPNWADGQPDWYPEEFFWVVGCSYAGLPESAAPVRNPIGASMAVRRAVFAQVGLFHGGVGRVGRSAGGCEETELAIRARRSGWSTFYEPASQVSHFVPSERHRPRYFIRRCWSEGRSKAMVTQLAGAGDALEAERSYVTRTIPRGVARQLRRRNFAGARGTVALMLGVLATAAGYASGRLSGLQIDERSAAPRLSNQSTTLVPAADLVT